MDRRIFPLGHLTVDNKEVLGLDVAPFHDSLHIDFFHWLGQWSFIHKFSSFIYVVELFFLFFFSAITNRTTLTAILNFDCFGTLRGYRLVLILGRL